MAMNLPNENLLDDRLNQIRAALVCDPRIDFHHHPVRLSFSEGWLSLEGSVKNAAAKKLAYAAAKRIMGDIPVVDRMRVDLAGSGGDGALRDEVCNLLSQENAFSEYGLRVVDSGMVNTLREPRGKPSWTIDMEVENGAVILRGCVGSLSHLRLAEVLAWWTADCQTVDNQLQVLPPEEDNDDELADAIRLALEKDPLVHPGQLSVHVENGVVTLSGYVASQEEKQLAVMDAWYVPGVWEVVDRIEAER